jgi:hypothetical protein
MKEPASLSRAGFEGDAFSQADALFDAILAGHSGIVFSRDDQDSSWSRLGNEGRRAS